MNPLTILPSQITSEHITQIIGLGLGLIGVLTLLINAVLVPLVSVLISNQRRNKTDTDLKIAAVSQKVDDNTKVSTEAFTAANGHNEKIVEIATKQVEAAKVAEEVKAAAEEVRRAAHEVKEAVTSQQPANPS